ncbi:hypothetical protein LCGC14_0244320 [marine sediment metagenome]|uniref:Uncharacterized protein n=1 Tax=marine sediment metagenome TaxID=412755 RepID=A0A0F9U6K5_9ZZZZ
MPRPKKELKNSHVTVDNDTEEPLSIIVSSLHKVADGFDQINESGLKRRAIVLLLHDATGVGKKDIMSILDAAPLLVERYTNPS